MVRQRLAELTVDRYPPEKLKFRSSLLLVHGLWTGSWCWENWATTFSNLGWDCLAINLRGRFGSAPSEELKRLSFTDAVADLRAAVDALPFPPVILAMNVGALVALAAAINKASALVLVSPAPPRNCGAVQSRATRLLRLKYSPLIFLRKPFRIEEKDFRQYLGNPLPAGKQSEVYARTIPDSPQLIRELFSTRVAFEPGAWSHPILVLAGGNDLLEPAETSRAFAGWLGAEFKRHENQGHWLIEHDGESVVRDIHRWLIQALADRILLIEEAC